MTDLSEVKIRQSKIKFMEEFMKTNKKDILSILLGNTLLALAVILFIVPGHLLSGGTTGISLFLNFLFKVFI